jgi:cytosine/adenosine deaminase-related metal-dependent hydrolase
MKKIGILSFVAAVLMGFTTGVFAQQWAVRDTTRVYFGATTDDPVPANYAGDGFADPAIFRASEGLWSVKDLTRVYLGASTDAAQPSDYNGDGSSDIAIFRPSAGLWSVRNITRAYFGNSLDTPVSEQGGGDFNGDGTADLAVFRPSAGLWAFNGLPRVYLGSTGDQAACHDYDGDGTTEVAIFRPSAGFWAVNGLSRFYFGVTGDIAVSGDYNADGTAEAGVFKGASGGLWAIRNLTRVYFGTAGNVTVPADYNGDGADEIAVYRSSYTPPTVIYQIQHDGLTGTVTVPGVVNLVYPTMGFFMADASGAYHGIYVNQTTYGPDIGDSVTLTGSVATANGKTMIQGLTAYSVVSKGSTPYAAATIGASSITDEQYEGCLVKVEDTFTVTNQNSGSGKWVVTGAGGPVTLDDELDYNYFPRNGDSFNAFVGVVERNTGSTPNQWLQARDTDDLEGPASVIPHYALKGNVVTMDDARNVFEGYYLEVKGESIESLSASAPAGVAVIDVDGLIFPGLINTHDHPSKGLWGTIPLPRLPGGYTCLNDWAGRDTDAATFSTYSDFKWQTEGEMFSSKIPTYPIGKLTEVRMASSGATATQGQVYSSAHNWDELAKLGVGIINGERFPGRVDQVVFPISEGEAYWTADHLSAVNGKLHRYMIHLSQSIVGGPEAYEFNWWKVRAGFDGHDTIIHGTSLKAADFALFSHADGNQTVLSWAAYCNELYYGAQPNIRAALDAGAVVAIGTDAAPWAWANMLAELNFCKHISDLSGWNIQSVQFADMLTRNGALAFGQLDRMGTIEIGKLANFMVIDDGAGDPYDDLLMTAGGGSSYNYQCGPKDVKLTIVAGRPIYGDADLLNAANFPATNAGYIEDLTICGTAKKLSIARDNPSSIQGVGDLFWTFYLDLWRRYNLTRKYPSQFVSVDPAGVLPTTPVPPTPTPAGYKTPTPSPTETPTPTITPTPEGYRSPSPTPSPDPAHLLLNPGFEDWTGAAPDHWTLGSNAAYADETGTVHSGSHSVGTTTTTDPGIYGAGFYQDVNVTVGQTYEFSSWLWSLQTGSMGITVSWWDNITAHYWTTPTSTSAGQWQQFSVQSTAPAGTVSARVWIRGFTPTAACGYGDDAEFNVVE